MKQKNNSGDYEEESIEEKKREFKKKKFISRAIKKIEKTNFHVEREGKKSQRGDD